MSFAPTRQVKDALRGLRNLARASRGSSQGLESVLSAELTRLKRRWGGVPRYIPENIRFLDYEFQVVDCASFLAQFKEIFIDQIYKFGTSKPAPFVIDCGANIGMSCLYLKRLYPSARILAFEADPVVAHALRANIARNQLSDVEVIDKAVWIDDAGVLFAADGADGGSVCGVGNKENVPSVSLRDLLEQRSNESVDLLKLDIEGAEVDVMFDCRNSLRNVENIFVEYHAWADQPQRLDELLSVLTKSEYRYHIHSLMDRSSPFVNQGGTLKMDMQLNIFAYRNGR